MKIKDESGFTTTGMAIALLLSISLLFTSAQVYRINTASAEVQEVADVCALAAENVVGEFMIAANLCDAALLSLTLLDLLVDGAAIIVACIPGVDVLAAELVQLSEKILEVRGKFARTASRGLDKLQKTLPYIAAIQGQLTASSQNGLNGQHNYFCAAVLIPLKGKDIAEPDDEKVKKAHEETKNSSEDVSEKTEEAEELAQEAAAAKERAYEHDCGLNPSFCLYERAESLAGLASSSNPYYSSVDSWSFAVALKRAQAYYRARANNESPASSNTAERAKSALRKIYYKYAAETLATGFVYETSTSFSANFPSLPSKLDELRSTSLYTQICFPISRSGEDETMHAWSGCPGMGTFAGTGSVKQLEEGNYKRCDECQFTPADLARVGGVTLYNPSGFEYHYRIIAEEASKYQKALNEVNPLAQEIENEVENVFDKIFAGIKDAISKRIEAVPPGSKGVIACVVDLSTPKSDRGFENAFVADGQTLGPRAAVSGATLLADPADFTESIITSLLDSFGKDAPVGVGAGRLVLDCWSVILNVYGKGQNAILDALESMINLIPFAGTLGIGKWAADTLRDGLEKIGLQPVNLDALRPVLIDTGTLAGSDDGAFAVKYSTIKEKALMFSSSDPELFGTLIEIARDKVGSWVGDTDLSIQIAEIEFPIGDYSIPIKFTLPDGLKKLVTSPVDDFFDSVGDLVGTVVGRRSWI